MSVNTFSKQTEIILRSIRLRSILVWTAPNAGLTLANDFTRHGVEPSVTMQGVKQENSTSKLTIQRSQNTFLSIVTFEKLTGEKRRYNIHYTVQMRVFY